MPKLGVNIDHVATLRQARRGKMPDPLFAAYLCIRSGADSIVAHLREDRRHIQDKDIIALRKKVGGKLNLEMSLTPEIVKLACKVKPYQATLVPEHRKELTTEGGLDVTANFKRIRSALDRLEDNGVAVSLFIDPDQKQISAAKRTGARIIELHTGCYADALNLKQRKRAFQEIVDATNFALGLGLTVNAGHGLDYSNVQRIAQIPGINELNIGYSIICKAVYVGLPEAVREMRELTR